MGNIFGNHWRVVSFGESHGQAMGVVVDGCPSQVVWDGDLLKRELDRRRPGRSRQITSARQEADVPELLSGVFEGKTLGTPVALIVRSRDSRSQDYLNMEERVGHADDVWRKKYEHVDPRGGGRSSGRETVSRVMAGALAQMFFDTQGLKISVVTAITQIGSLRMGLSEEELVEELSSRQPMVKSHNSLTGFWEEEKAREAELLLESAQREGESFGAELILVANGVPEGLGGPVFHKLKADLSSALMGVGAVCSVQLGVGFSLQDTGGSFHLSAHSKKYGGVRGGISTGEPLVFRIHWKPTASIGDVARRGRHDPCVALRGRVVLENMVKLVLADHILGRRLDRSLRF